MSAENDCCGGSSSAPPSEPCGGASPPGGDRPDDYKGYANPARWTLGTSKTGAGDIALVSPRLGLLDVLNGWRVRWGVRRNHYRIRPGLYGIGNPDSGSPVLVTANYKLTFDKVRRELGGVDAWLLVLDTKGINVWCAAGKGTFGTGEIIERVAATRLRDVVSHRVLVLPQLGAPGVAAHDVRKGCGFQAKYGPVRARDIRAYIERGLVADGSMRKVRFNWLDRVVLAPMELAGLSRNALAVLGILAIFHLAGTDALDPRTLVALAGAVLAGTVVVPALLPLIPGRAFAFKGWLVGWLWTTAFAIANGWLTSAPPPFLVGLSAFLILPPVSAFLAMNFTGSSAYTSLSGVLKEMRLAVPGILVSVTIGAVLLAIAVLGGG